MEAAESEHSCGVNGKKKITETAGGRRDCHAGATPPAGTSTGPKGTIGYSGMVHPHMSMVRPGRRVDDFIEVRLDCPQLRNFFSVW